MTRSSPQRIRPRQQPASACPSPVGAASPPPRSHSVPAYFASSFDYSTQPGYGEAVYSPAVISRSTYDLPRSFQATYEAQRNRQSTTEITFSRTRTSRYKPAAASVPQQPSSVSARHTTRPVVDNRITLLVLGLTGVGKSAFISQLIRSGTRASSSERPVIGYALESCTAQVAEYPCVVDGQEYTLVDTPGFDDTRRSDTDVLKSVADYLALHYRSGRRIHGIIFLHRILDVRLSASAIKVAEIVKRICGPDFYPYVALVTNMWQLLPDRGPGDQRAGDLLDHPKFWKDFDKGGATHFQSRNSRESGAETILRDFARGIAGHDRELAKKGKNFPVLQIQSEMFEDGLSISDTAAGNFLEGELRRRKERHQKEIQRIKDEIRQASQENDIESTKVLSQSLGAKLSQIQKDENDLDGLQDAKSKTYVQKNREDGLSRSYPESSGDAFGISRGQHNNHRRASFSEQESPHNNVTVEHHFYRVERPQENAMPSEGADHAAKCVPPLQHQTVTHHGKSSKGIKIQRLATKPNSLPWWYGGLCEVRPVPRTESRRRAPS